MITRVSTSQQHTQMLEELQRVTSDYADSWNKVSTGKKLSQPYEDPMVSVQIMGLKREVSLLDSFIGSANALLLQLTLEDDLLSGYFDTIGSIRQMLLEANNGMLTNADISTYGGVLKHHIDTIIDFLNSSDAEGVYLFAGAQTHTPPVTLLTNGIYQYNTNDDMRMISIGATTEVPARDTAWRLCFHVDDGATGFNYLDELELLKGELKTVPTDFADKLAIRITQTDQTLEQLRSIRMSLGSRMQILNDAISQHKLIIDDLNKQIGALGDLDMTATLSEISRNEVVIEALRKSITKVNDLSLFKYL